MVALIAGLMATPAAALAQSSGTIEGHILDEASGLPLVDWVAVTAYDDASGEPVATMDVPTDADGRYEISVPAGTYRLVFDDARLMGYEGEWWQDKPDFASADPVVVGEGEIAGPFDFVVARPPDTGGWIAGTVTDANGVPLWRINWVVYDLAGNQVASGRTDESGDYRTTSLGTGSFKIAFEDTAVFTYESSWFGGSDFETATVIGVDEGLEVEDINVSLARLADASGPPLPVTGGFEVEVLGAAILLLSTGVGILLAARRVAVDE
jgi:5-hydroxyisourate hydrolase-like protein (transthyretin family)